VADGGYACPGRQCFPLNERSGQKIPKRSPRKLEKLPVVAGFTTKACRFPKTDTADHVPPARSEIFSVQKLLVRKLVLPDLFCRESFWAGFFSARKFKNRKNFRLKVKKSKKKLARKLKKRELVRQLTHVPVVNHDLLPKPGLQKTRTFFGREISRAGKFLARKLRIAKKVDAKFFRPVFLRFEI